MSTIRNTSVRLFHLPAIATVNEEGKVETFGERMSLAPRGTLEVPDWYVAELRKERGWARRMSADGVVSGPKGAAGLFEARAIAMRDARDKAKAETDALRDRNVALEARLAALEAQVSGAPSEEKRGRRHG